MYINLGNISEDVLRDGKRFFENGISGAVTKAAEDSSGKWGKVPANPIQVTQAFSNDPADRELQDAGFDGLINDAETRKFKAYLDALLGTYGSGSPIYQKALTDPSKDDYKNYRDASYDQSQTGILGRYKNINNPNILRKIPIKVFKNGIEINGSPFIHQGEVAKVLNINKD